MRKPVLTTPPAELAVSLAQAKAQLRVTHSAEDSLIGIYLAGAIERLDGWGGILGRCLVAQTWRQDLAGFCPVMRLPFPDVDTVSVAYSDDSNQPQVLDAANYVLVNDTGRAEIRLAEGGSFPSTYPRPDAVRITLTCGYGAAEDVPAPLKNAILTHVALQHSHRAEGGFPQSYLDMIAPYRVVGV